MHLLFLILGIAIANEPEEEPKVIYKQKTEIDFEGVEVDGTLVKPQGSLVLERKRAQFNSMIKSISSWVASFFPCKISGIREGKK